MKKTILSSLVVAASLGLTGCNDSGSSNGEPTLEVRNVSLSVLPETISDTYTTNEQGYVHNFLMDGYTVHVDELEQGESFKVENVSLLDSLNFSVIGDAQVTITHPQVKVRTTNYESYSLQGGSYIEQTQNNVSVTVQNEQFVFVTLDDSVDVFSHTLNDESMVDASGYTYAYVTKESVLHLETSKGNTTLSVPFVVNSHQAYKVDWNKDGNIIIGDPNWGGAEPIQPVQPVLSSNSVIGAEIINYDITTGAVAVEVTDEAGKAATNVTVGTFLYDVEFNIDIEKGNDMYVNIYTSVGTFDYHIDSADVIWKDDKTGTHHTIGNGLDYLSSDEFKNSDLGGATMKLWTELPTGNVMLRMKDVDGADLTGTVFTVNEFSAK